MQLQYREDKATQAAARLLSLHGGTMNHMKLIKLLYFADRRMLLQCGRPISFDWYYSLPHGPVLSFTLNKINAEPDPEGGSYWHEYISERQDNEVSLLVDRVPNDQLSPAEEQTLDAVFAEFGSKTQWELRDLSHQLPEWQDPHGSSVPIEIRDILVGEGLSEEDAQEIVEALSAEAEADRLLGQ